MISCNYMAKLTTLVLYQECYFCVTLSYILTIIINTLAFLILVFSCIRVLLKNQ